MSFSCQQHGWATTQSPCPSCPTITMFSGTIDFNPIPIPTGYIQINPEIEERLTKIENDIKEILRILNK